MWPFKPSPFLDEDTMRWHVDIVCWYLHHFGQKPVVTESRLILPGPYHYKLDGLEGEELGRGIFTQTKALAHMSQLDIRAPNNDGEPNDVYRMVVLSARRVARSVVASAPKRPPVNRDEIRAVVDIVACMMGFGIFIANHAIIDTYYYRHGTKGGDALIRSSTADPDCILSERDLVFDIALFLSFRGLKPNGAFDYLEKQLNEQLGDALRSAAAFTEELKAAAW